MFYDVFLKLCDTKPNKTMTQIVKEIGISWSLVSAWKNKAAEPQVATKKRIAEYFGVSIADLSNESFNPDRYTVPVYGKIACGLPIEAVENIIGYEELPIEMKKQGEFIALQVEGDSMFPRILSGDIVIIRKTCDFYDGQVCAVMIDNEATLKKVMRRGDVLTLIPNNPNYPIMNYTKEQAQERHIAVLGVAVEVRGKI